LVQGFKPSFETTFFDYVSQFLLLGLEGGSTGIWTILKPGKEFKVTILLGNKFRGLNALITLWGLEQRKGFP